MRRRGSQLGQGLSLDIGKRVLLLHTYPPTPCL
ncbi:uncharacterized protein METZ01_LOCUS217693, partial [marine metagenome]